MRTFALLTVVALGCNESVGLVAIEVHGCSLRDVLSRGALTPAPDGVLISGSRSVAHIAGGTWAETWRWERSESSDGSVVAVIPRGAGFRVFTGREQIDLDAGGTPVAVEPWAPPEGRRGDVAGQSSFGGGFFAVFDDGRGPRIHRFDADGTRLWGAEPVDNPGRIFALAALPGGGAAYAHVRVGALKADGRPAWDVALPSGTSARALATDDAGDVAAGGVALRGRAEPWMGVWDDRGAARWTIDLPAGARGDHTIWTRASVVALAATPEGWVFVGERCGHPDQCELWHGLLDRHGRLVREGTTRRDNLEDPETITVLDDGGVVVLGSSRECCGDAFGGEHPWLMHLNADATCAVR